MIKRKKVGGTVLSKGSGSLLVAVGLPDGAAAHLLPARKV